MANDVKIEIFIFIRQIFMTYIYILNGGRTLQQHIKEA